MQSSPRQRWSVIGGALLLTLAAMYFVDQEEQQDGVAQNASHRPHTLKNTLSAGPLDVSSSSRSFSQNPSSTSPGNSGVLPEIGLQRMRAAHQGKDAPHPDLLGTRAWYVPPAPQAAVGIPVEKPVAPPVPFHYMGKLEDSPQGTLIFLAIRNKVQTVMIGQIVEGAWRLDSEDASALHLTYLPLGTAHVLSKTARRAAALNAIADSQSGSPQSTDTPSTYRDN